MSDILKDTIQWFELAKRNPGETEMRVQVGVHVEEVSEMFRAIGFKEDKQLEDMGNALKKGTYPRNKSYAQVDRKELLDSLCDQIVTAVGIAHMYGLDIHTGLDRVNKSNWSKFVDGKPVFDENGKITKGPNYKKPDLEGLY